MARRASTTPIGSIAGGDLSEVGAGKEGWLVSNPNLVTALDTHYLAIANKLTVIVTGWSSSESDRVRIRPELSPIDAEYISAIEWLVFGDDVRGLAIGTSSGYLMVYSFEGHLIHRQRIYFTRIIKIRVRGTKRDLQHDMSSEEVCVVMSGVIARFDGSDIQNNHSKIPYQLWNINKYGTCADAAITGVMPPPLMEVQSSERYYCAVTVGEDAVISAFRLSEDKSRSFVGAILSKVVPATFSTIASVAKLLWRSDSKTPKAAEEKIQSFARASPLTCIKDHPRKGEKLTLSPSGTLAAITDSLGRILLLDTQARVVVRLWKGYRDASCLFIEMLVNKDAESSSSNYYGAVKSDYCLCLAIHAPRKGIIEVWKMRTGPRLLSVQCSKGSKMLQPTYRFGTSTESSLYSPLEVFILNGDSSQISVLNKTMR
ncbi:unnamed protein product [Rhodiola kirilowii]